MSSRGPLKGLTGQGLSWKRSCYVGLRVCSLMMKPAASSDYCLALSIVPAEEVPPPGFSGDSSAPCLSHKFHRVKLVYFDAIFSASWQTVVGRVRLPALHRQYLLTPTPTRAAPNHAPPLHECLGPKHPVPWMLTLTPRNDRCHGF